MPEFIIKTRSSGEKYEENDIIGVANRRHIRCEHASRLCSRYAPQHRNADGFIALGSLAEKWYQRTRQYRFERVSRDEIKRINQWTGTEIVYGSTPVEDPDRPGKMIHCNVNNFFLRRRYHVERNKKGELVPVKERDKHVICGSPGSEVYYAGDGKQDTSHARLDLVWNDITNETGLRDVDFPYLNLSTLTLKRHLVLPVDDFDDETASDLVSPLLDESDPENPVVIKKRKHQVDWRALLPVDIPPETRDVDVLDVRKRVDIRQRSGPAFRRTNIVTTKTR